MILYSIELRDWLFLKDYELLSFAKNISKNLGEKISKNFSGKNSQKLIDLVKKSAAKAIKTLQKKHFKKTAESTGNLLDNKIVDKITKVSKSPTKII